MRPEANDVALCASVSQFVKPGTVMVIRILPVGCGEDLKTPPVRVLALRSRLSAFNNQLSRGQTSAYQANEVLGNCRSMWRKCGLWLRAPDSGGAGVSLGHSRCPRCPHAATAGRSCCSWKDRSHEMRWHASTGPLAHSKHSINGSLYYYRPHCMLYPHPQVSMDHG